MRRGEVKNNKSNHSFFLFVLNLIQDDLNDQIDSMHKTQEEFNELSNKFSELSRELKKLVSEEVNKRKEIIDEIK